VVVMVVVMVAALTAAPHSEPETPSRGGIHQQRSKHRRGYHTIQTGGGFDSHLLVLRVC